MQKIKITLEVPERIAVLVQKYVQYELTGLGAVQFCEYLMLQEVHNPTKCLSEISIGIEHPDDEPVKIRDFLRSENKEVSLWWEENYIPEYKDNFSNRHMYSIESLDEELIHPKYVLDFIASVKATDCSYFRFVN